jgi:hypothetical protein
MARKYSSTTFGALRFHSRRRKLGARLKKMLLFQFFLAFF